MPKTEPLFRSAYNHAHERNIPFPEYATPTGNRYQSEYGYEIDKYGRKILVKTGETDLYAKIQESLEETKIENIINRCIAGDTSVLRPDGVYMDTTEAPSNLLEAMQQIQQLENVWASLSNEIKAKYNYDPGEFVAKAGSEEWQKDIGLWNEPDIPSPINDTPKSEEGTKDE